MDSVARYLFHEPLVLVTQDESFDGRTKPIAFRLSVSAAQPDPAGLDQRHTAAWLSGTTGRAMLTQGALARFRLPYVRCY